MTELKTLEIITEPHFKGEKNVLVSVNILKKEAIKWIKELESLENNPKEYTDWVFMKRTLHHHITNTKQLRLWIKHFFNIK